MTGKVYLLMACTLFFHLASFSGPALLALSTWLWVPSLHHQACCLLLESQDILNCLESLQCCLVVVLSVQLYLSFLLHHHNVLCVFPGLVEQ